MQRQEALLNKIKQDGKRYARAMAEAADAAHAMAGHIAELAELAASAARRCQPPTTRDRRRQRAAAGNPAEQVAARARQLVAMMDTRLTCDRRARSSCVAR